MTTLEKNINNLRSVACGLSSSTMISKNEAERYKNLSDIIEALHKKVVSIESEVNEIAERVDRHIENQIFCEAMNDPDVKRLINLVADKINNSLKR